jgi:hypothetical protein
MRITCLFFIFSITFILSSCVEKDGQATYPTIDYLTVRKKLDTLNIELNAHGYSPTITVLSNNNKRLAFFGASHTRTVDHPQFKALQKEFLAQNPQIAFNEGGQVSKKYNSVDSAILNNGETGLLKYLCDRQNIAMLDGDMSAKEEFAGLLKQFPEDQVYLYMAVERFLNPFKQGYNKNLSFEEAFQKEHVAYLENNGFNLSAEEKTTDYLRKLYAKYFKQPLDLNHLVEVHDYYLTNMGIFGKIGRTSKDIRDQVLLSKIDKALDEYDRVFIVFGGSHWVAVQPALRYIINKSR